MDVFSFTVPAGRDRWDARLSAAARTERLSAKMNVGPPSQETMECGSGLAQDWVKSGRAQRVGSATRELEPLPAPSLSAQARPPIASASARTIARPMPEPPSARERDGSTR